MTRISPAAAPFAHGEPVRREVQREVLLALWRAIAGLMRNAIAAFAERRRVRRAIAELNALSDHMLRDIGIERHDIARVVRYGRDATELRK